GGGRAPDQARSAIAQKIKHSRRRNVVDVGKVGDDSGVDPSIAFRVDPIADFARTEIENIGAAGSIQIGQQDAAGVELAVGGDRRGTLHQNRIAELAVAELRPIFDATVADLNLVDEAIAGHVGEEEIEREILIEWDPRSAGLWPRNLYGIAESVFPF